MNKIKNKFNVYYLIIIVCVLSLCVGYILYTNNSYSLTEYMTPDNKQTPREIMKTYNVIFAGTIRNVDPYIENTLKNIDLCGAKFNDYAVILYENDSTDNTRNILQTSKKSNYYYIIEDNITEPLRTVRLTNGRNKILEKMYEINKNNYYDFLIMLDMDDRTQSGKFVESIESCFETNMSKWDVLTGNQSGNMYDLWALRQKNGLDYDCWLEYHKHSNTPNAHYKYVDRHNIHHTPGQLLEVDSAFGGIAIYRLATMPKQCRYNGLHETGEEKCEHVDFHACIKDNGGNIYINTSFLTD